MLHAVTESSFATVRIKSSAALTGDDLVAASDRRKDLQEDIRMQRCMDGLWPLDISGIRRLFEDERRI